jgi:SAM-dependent methyltransferase
VWQLTYTQADNTTGTVHRQDQEFWQLNALMKKLDKNAPALTGTAQEALEGYLSGLLSNPSTSGSMAFMEFLSLNVTGPPISNVCWQFKYMVGGMTDFIKTLASNKLPLFSPEFVPITEANMFTTPETPLECWVYTRSIQLGLKDIFPVYGMNLNYSNAMVTSGATFMRDNDNDVLFPGAAPISVYPDGYKEYPVHNQAGNPGGVSGYLNGGNLRLEYTSQNKFYFLIEENIRKWVVDVHLGGDESTNPKRWSNLKILDVGSGCGLSTFVYADLFPNASVTGIDIAAPYARFQRARAQHRGSKNTQFYWLNAQNMSAIPDNTYDIVSFTYVLHEMKRSNSMEILKEIKRVLKPGGAVSGFEVSYIENAVQRELLEHFTTFGKQGDKDYEETGLHGPEPFMVEFQSLNLPFTIKDMFPNNARSTLLSQFDTVYYGEKPKTSSEVSQL